MRNVKRTTSACGLPQSRTSSTIEIGGDLVKVHNARSLDGRQQRRTRLHYGAFVEVKLEHPSSLAADQPGMQPQRKGVRAAHDCVYSRSQAVELPW